FPREEAHLPRESGNPERPHGYPSGCLARFALAIFGPFTYRCNKLIAGADAAKSPEWWSDWLLFLASRHSRVPSSSVILPPVRVIKDNYAVIGYILQQGTSTSCGAVAST